MKRFCNLLVWMVLVLVACQPEEVVREVPVEVTRIVTETITEEVEQVEVTRIVTETITEGVEQVEFPTFPWPPPHASTSTLVPMSTLLDSDKVEQGLLVLGDVDRYLREALEAAEYYDKSYYTIPDGFALVTRLEQIDPDGTPKKGDARWSVEISLLHPFSIQKYISALFIAPRGYYRVIVFVITSHPFQQSSETLSFEDAEVLQQEGANIIPQSIAEINYDENYVTTALVYNFEKPGREEDAILQEDGIPPAQQQLEKANLWDSLR